MNAEATTSAPILFTRLQAARAVPPVANKSSITRTLSPFFNASAWISIVSVPYSKEYSSLIVSAGSLFGFLIGTKPAPSL